MGVHDRFNSKNPPKTYRFGSSLDSALSWDENRDRDQAEWLLGLVRCCAIVGEAASHPCALVPSDADVNLIGG